MAIPAVHGNNVAAAQGANATAPAQNGSQAPVSTASTMTSAANENTGVFAQMKNLVSRFFAGVSNCLSYIPLVGRLFTRYESTNPIQQQQMPATDAEKATEARNLLAAQTAGTVMTDAHFDRIVALFIAITDPMAKNEMFRDILNSAATTVELATASFNALPATAQDVFKAQCFAANGSSVFNGHDHGAGFGDHIVHEAILSDVSKRAAAAMATPAPVVPPVPEQAPLLRTLMSAVINPQLFSLDATIATAAENAIATAYNALSDTSKNAVKAQIWYHNNRVDTQDVAGTVYDRSGVHGTHGHGIGAFVVGYDMKNPLLRTAVQNVLSVA